MATGSKKNDSGFTAEVPEFDTLVGLAARAAIRVFEMEHIVHGLKMCIAHFDHDGWRHLYQNGHGVGSSHLYFHIQSWKLDAPPAEELAQRYFEGHLILSD